MQEQFLFTDRKLIDMHMSLRACILTIFVTQVQISSCFDEELDTWQIPSGAHKVQAAASHNHCHFKTSSVCIALACPLLCNAE